MKTSNVLVSGIAGQATGIALGLLITVSGMPFGPHIGGLITLVLVGLILFNSLAVLQLTEVLWLLPAWALAYVVILQIFGFVWFPGLVKDLELFSREHLLNSELIFGLVLAAYAGAFAVLKLAFGRRGKS